MHLLPGSQVCTGCGAVLQAAPAPEVAPTASTAPAAEIAAPPAELGPNPWRTTPAEGPSPVAVEAPAVEATVAPELEMPVPVPVSAPPPPPIVERKPILAFDPLPPAPVHIPADAPVSIGLAAEPSSIPVLPSEDPGAVRGVSQAAEATLAVPAAYASFAPESAARAEIFDPYVETAEVVELSFPEVLTVAPPASHLPGWPAASEAR